MMLSNEQRQVIDGLRKVENDLFDKMEDIDSISRTISDNELKEKLLLFYLKIGTVISEIALYINQFDEEDDNV